MIDFMKDMFDESEQPLDKLVEGYSRTSVFRKIAFVGDSLSSGEFETCDKEGKKRYHDLFEYSWGQYIARRNGLTAFNFSKGGMTTKQYVESFAEQRGFWDADKACQAYVIALGVNDLWNNRVPELGSISDVDFDDYHNNKPTYTGYYATIVQRYKEISPDAKFFFVTMPDSDNPDRHEKSVKCAEILYALAERFDNAYVIDLFKYAPAWDENFRAKFNMYGHLTPSGYIFTAQMVDSYIDYIVRHNPDDFKTVGFIGTNIQYKFD